MNFQQFWRLWLVCLGFVNVCIAIIESYFNGDYAAGVWYLVVGIWFLERGGIFKE